MEAKEIKKIYDKLEPKKYSRLELTDFKGVVLTFDECFVTVQKVVDLELHNRKLQTELKEARDRVKELEGGNELKKPTPPPNIKGTFAI